ncbi:FYVE, RhoGEF and PH domain-containing protein 6-like [Oreochromis aureus]|uniref:FYVE, RhoGEF and PH domain containing 6 n=1 Tax=Oreochromis aureus TaxID=47969 RepID=A0A668U349_OREAU|nr:FYVE, RhoGEF and PH domain-containing protein 6-like [Oreochromis aureus]
MMNSGMHKPPVAPKPKLPYCGSPRQSPLIPRKGGLSQPSPGTQRKVKPALAPKPCPSKFNVHVEERQPVWTSPRQTSVSDTPQTVGRLGSQNGLQHESKKPDWDYVVPICLCSSDNCTCVKNRPTSREKLERDLKAPQKGKSEENRKTVVNSHGTCNHSREKTDNEHCRETNASPTHNHYQSVQDAHAIYQNVTVDTNISRPKVAFRPTSPHRTRGNEANDEILDSVPGRVPEEDALSVPRPKVNPAPLRKPSPIPVLRKPKQAFQDHQEKVENEREESVSQDFREINTKNVAASPDRKGTSSLSVSAPESEKKLPVFPSVKTWPPPAPPPKKKPFLSELEKVLSSAPQAIAKDVKGEHLDWARGTHELDFSAEKDNKKIQRERKADEEEARGILHSQPALSQPVATAEKIGMGKVPPKKPQRKKMLNQNKGSSEERAAREIEGHGKKKELPLPSTDKSSGNHPAAEVKRQSRSSLSKAKSFSGADIIHSKKVQKSNSFRKLPLKLSTTRLPRQTEKEDQFTDFTLDDNELSVDNDEDLGQNYPERKFSAPFTEFEQNVDGEDEGEVVPFEDTPVYEEILDYGNVGNSGPYPQDLYSQPKPWQSSVYADPQGLYLHPDPSESSVYDNEDIYEVQDPYMSLEKDHQQTPALFDRSSFEKDIFLEVPLDDDFIHTTSEDEGENDSSSDSSKGDPEQPEEKTTASEKKKNKIFNIAQEIMTSESVFVDVLKLLHVDFRDAVSKASRQSGKPVIEDRLLNQILYSLPQLYELNQNLLSELRQRIAKWNENPQVADIFLKQGPYLKMYSTYIGEFDRNVVLLDEQTKKNPAFGAVVREFEASPRCASLALKHYLLKPVQRIPQYQLLLTDYLKNLPEDADDYKDTEAALAIVKEVASHANDFMKQGDIFQSMIRVQCRLIGNHEIVQPGRIYLKEGILMKLSRKVMQPRMFFLFNDMLLYTKPVQSGQFMFKNMLPLRGMKVSKPSQEAYQNELNIVSVERSFILSASSAKEQDEWLEAISTAISEHTKKTSSFTPGKSQDVVDGTDGGDGAPLGSKAPIWIPDKRASMCMICTSKFTQTWRRHHCRACGKIACQACSSNEFPLEYKKNKLTRVCDQCFQVLLEQKGEQTQPLGKRTAFTFHKKQKLIPAALKEVTANTDNSSMSGYLQASKVAKKHGKRLWFVIKDKVLYKYAASEDVAALESLPLLGFVVKADSSQTSQFKLYHHNKVYYIFKADSPETAQKWIKSFEEAAVL